MKSRMLKFTEPKHPLSKIPPERVKALQSILYDRETISVYCDCSAIQNQNIISVAACFVGDGETNVESKKLHIEYTNVSMYAELKAVSFSISMLPKIIERYRSRLIKPDRIVVFTDCSYIEQLLQSEKAPSKNSMREVVSEVRQNLEEFERENKGYNLSISYIGEEKKHNMYHRAAHNAARHLLAKK